MAIQDSTSTANEDKNFTLIEGHRFVLTSECMSTLAKVRGALALLTTYPTYGMRSTDPDDVLTTVGTLLHETKKI